MQRELEELIAEIEELDESRKRLEIEAFRVLSVLDADLCKLAIQVLDSEEQCGMWFASKVPVLGDQMPLRLALRGQRERVVDCLYQIEYGGIY